MAIQYRMILELHDQRHSQRSIVASKGNSRAKISDTNHRVEVTGIRPPFNTTVSVDEIWRSVLPQTEVGMDVDFESLNKEGLPYPELATAIIQKYADLHTDCSGKNSYETAKNLSKQNICSLAIWHSNDEQRVLYGGY